MNTKLEKKFGEFQKALLRLQECYATPIETPRDVAGVIQHFEFVYDLAWKALKNLLETKGKTFEPTPRQTFLEAYQTGLIDDEEKWLKMLTDRNLTSHTYHEELAKELIVRIQSDYLPLFQKLNLSFGKSE